MVLSLHGISELRMHWLHQQVLLTQEALDDKVNCLPLIPLLRFLELQFPQRSKALRTGAFVLPFIFDTVPLFYRVSLSGTNTYFWMKN